MASYSTMNTIPAADVEAETPLLQRDIKINAKTLVGGAAAAAFALGALGATAVSSPAAPPAPAALYSAPRAPAALHSAAGDYTPGWNNIELSSSTGDHSMCLVGAGQGPLSVEKCAPHFGAFSKVRNDDGTVTLQSGGLCLTGLRGASADFEAGMSFGLWTCNEDYADWQNFEVSGSYKTELMLPASNLCVSAEGSKAIAAFCDNRPEQKFRLVQSSANNPAPAPRPSPRPAPRPHHHKYGIGHSCSKDSDCESGDCHKHDGPYKNKCKEPSGPSPRPSPTKKPTPGPPPNCGRKCSKDSDCKIGGFLQYPTCYVEHGTRCHGYCGP